MITIDKADYVGIGVTRVVYLHPEDPTKILKVYVPEATPEKIRAQRWHRRFAPVKRFDSNYRDVTEHTKVRARHPELRSNVCEVFGYLETNLGSAIAAERVADIDGTTSLTLSQHIERSMPEDIIEPLKSLYAQLAEHHVRLRDSGPGNILVRRKTDGIELVIVDGLGELNLIPIASIVKSVNRKKLNKKLAGLIRKLNKLKRKTEKQAFEPSQTEA